jgi:hypothetical protein
MAKAGKKDLLIMTNSGDLYVVDANKLGRPIATPRDRIAQLKRLLRQHKGEAIGLIAAVYGKYDAEENGSAMLSTVQKIIEKH